MRRGAKMTGRRGRVELESLEQQRRIARSVNMPPIHTEKSPIRWADSRVYASVYASLNWMAGR